jgi:hypothetical protein
MIPSAGGAGEGLKAARRLVRSRGRDASLRRRTDRIESVMMAVLMAVFLVGGPLLGVAAGRRTDAGTLAQARAQASWHQVRAVLLARGAQGLADFGGDWATLSAPARWTAGGRAHTGRVPADAADRPGQAVRVWVNGAGRPTGAPPGQADRPLRIALAVTGMELGLAVLLALAGAAGRQLLDRRRLAAWDQAWRETAPLWTRRYRHRGAA